MHLPVRVILDREGDLDCTVYKPMSVPLEATEVLAVAAAATATTRQTEPAATATAAARREEVTLDYPKP